MNKSPNPTRGELDPDPIDIEVDVGNLFDKGVEEAIDENAKKKGKGKKARVFFK